MRNGFATELTELALEQGARLGSPPDEAGLIGFLREHKVTSAGLLAEKLRATKAPAERVPEFFVELIERTARAVDD